MTRHNIAQAAAIICEGSRKADRDRTLWVAKQLRAGRFSGYKLGREWFMTDADIAAAIESCRRGSTAPSAPGSSQPVEPRPAAAPSIVDGLSARAARRLRVM